MGKQEKFVKKRIMNIAYAHSHYVNYPGRRGYFEKYPEDKWFNYLGEYTGRYKTTPGLDDRRWNDWNESWKEKYLSRRSRLKRVTINKVNDQVGERYYTLNK